MDDFDDDLAPLDPIDSYLIGGIDIEEAISILETELWGEIEEVQKEALPPKHAC